MLLVPVVISMETNRRQHFQSDLSDLYRISSSSSRISKHFQNYIHSLSCSITLWLNSTELNPWMLKEIGSVLYNITLKHSLSSVKMHPIQARKKKSPENS